MVARYAERAPIISVRAHIAKTTERCILRQIRRDDIAWDRQKIGTKKMAKPHYVFLIL